MGPSKPGEVRQNRSHVLLNKSELLGVGFKSNNQKRSGQASFGGKTLADEIKALRGEHHVTVLVKQTQPGAAGVLLHHARGGRAVREGRADGLRHRG